VADITDVRLPTTFAYLAAIRDADAWAVAASVGSSRCRIDTRLTLAALERALTLHRPALGLVHHSGRGV